MKLPDKEPLIDYTHVMRSRYGETDKMGYVYYGRYLDYFEAARTEMIRHYGLSYLELEESGIMLPVIHAELDYRKPVFYDTEMRIRVLVYDLPVVQLKTYYEIRTEFSEEIHVLGGVNLCFIDAVTRKPCRAPKTFLNLFKKNVKE